MSNEKTTAIVLRVIEFSESSCVVTMMTRDFGKITALAKGARRQKSPFQGALDLLSISRIVFLHKKTESLDLLTEAKLERRFRSAGRDLVRLYSAYYLAELLSVLTDIGDPHPELYDWAEWSLISIDECERVPLTVLRFEMAALILLGHGPQLMQCVYCGKRKPDQRGRTFFGLDQGGIVCSGCRPGKMDVVTLSESAWNNLVQLSGMSRGESSWIPGFEGELRQFMNRVITYHLGFRPRLQKYLSKSARQDGDGPPDHGGNREPGMTKSDSLNN